MKHLLEYLNVNIVTGIITWKKKTAPRSKKGIGSVAGTLCKGYIRIGVLGRYYYAHVLVWYVAKGKLPVYELDHINRIRHDNRIENLRDITHVKNLHNSPKHYDNENGSKGVSWDATNKKWRVRIMEDRKEIWLGRYKDKKIAEAKYLEAEKQLLKH